ncbi:MAG: hypothetical protein K8F91_25900 [Candidatus Obscuribacterales bacterium]|nr:hypothetical protein [Candidatus Obscuribacterales bacterium]
MSLALTLLVSSVFLSACTKPAADQVLKLQYEISTTDTQVPPDPSKEGVPVDEAKSSDESAGKTTKKTTKTVSFLLADHALGLDEDGRKTIYDFAAKRILQLDSKAKTFEDHSLYVQAGFKDAEVKNRAMLAELFCKPGVDSAANGFSPYDIACELGMDLPKQPEDPGITIRDEENRAEFYYGGKVVAEAEFAETVPEAHLPMLEKLYVFNCNLHPFVREKIQSRNRHVKELSYDLRTMGTVRNVRMLLKDSALVEDDLAVPASYRRVFDKKSALYPMQKKIFSAKTVPVFPGRKAVFEQAQAFLAKNQQVDAFLTMIEYNLATGEQANEETRKILATALIDPVVKQITANIQPPSKEAAQASLKVLESIDSKKYAKGYLIGIFKGNLAASLGEDASKMFVEALEGNPLIASAYKDLGDFYYSRFEAGYAWESWDLGRKVRPTHPMLAEVTSLEKGLEEAHPEYF